MRSRMRWPKRGGRSVQGVVGVGDVENAGVLAKDTGHVLWAAASTWDLTGLGVWTADARNPIKRRTIDLHATRCADASLASLNTEMTLVKALERPRVGALPRGVGLRATAWREDCIRAGDERRVLAGQAVIVVATAQGQEEQEGKSAHPVRVPRDRVKWINRRAKRAHQRRRARFHAPAADRTSAVAAEHRVG